MSKSRDKRLGAQDRRRPEMALYQPPFTYQDGHILDSSSRKVSIEIMGEIIAQALNEYWLSTDNHRARINWPWK